jgi:hypothetical protein
VERGHRITPAPAGGGRTRMKQPIVGYHTDDEGHWVAELACGHGQHVRHDPPWQVREWVTSPEGRDSFLGTELNCLKCDDDA